MPRDNEDSQSWHLDKKVPITLMLTIAVQTGTIIWWARGQEAKDIEMDRRLIALERARENERVSERLAVLESRILDILGASTRIEARLATMEHTPPATGKGVR